MSKYDIGLMVFATCLMVAITISYIVKDIGVVESAYTIKIGKDGSDIFPQVVRIKNDAYESWNRPEIPRKLRNADQQEEDLIKHIREKWILPPSGVGRRLNHPEKYDHSEFGESFVVDKMLKNIEHGFYVEAWAGDGETNSNSLFFEKDRQWNGIIIEPNPHEFIRLLGKRRQAFVINACVSPTTTPAILNLTYTNEGSERTVDVQCFPMFSILAALGRVRVDYMSLRAEGMEADIIRSLPLDGDQMDVQMFTVRTLIENDKRTSNKNKDAVRKLLESKGYRWIDAGDKLNKFNVIMQRDKYGKRR